VIKKKGPLRLNDRLVSLSCKPDHVGVCVPLLAFVFSLDWDLRDDGFLDSSRDTAALKGLGNLAVESLNGAAPSAPLAVTRKKAREPAGLLVPLGLVLLEALVVIMLVIEDGCVPGPLTGVVQSHSGVG